MATNGRACRPKRRRARQNRQPAAADEPEEQPTTHGTRNRAHCGSPSKREPSYWAALDRERLYASCQVPRALCPPVPYYSNFLVRLRSKTLIARCSGRFRLHATDTACGRMSRAAVRQTAQRSATNRCGQTSRPIPRGSIHRPRHRGRARRPWPHSTWDDGGVELASVAVTGRVDQTLAARRAHGRSACRNVASRSRWIASRKTRETGSSR
jgi:hypothetical protein